MRRAVLPVFAAFCLILYLAVFERVWEVRGQVRSDRTGYIIPSKFSRVLAVGNKGLLSDFLFLKVMTYYGEHVMRSQTMSEQDWNYIQSGLDVVTDLDPYFLDPYTFTQGTLAWEKKAQSTSEADGGSREISCEHQERL